MIFEDIDNVNKISYIIYLPTSQQMNPNTSIPDFQVNQPIQNTSKVLRNLRDTTNQFYMSAATSPVNFYEQTTDIREKIRELCAIINDHQSELTAEQQHDFNNIKSRLTLCLSHNDYIKFFP